MTEPIGWIESYAASRGYRYEPDADERWLRVWEPYTTLKVPVRYEHALHWTGGSASVTLARAVFLVKMPAPGGAVAERELGAWIALAQDERHAAHAAVTSDRGGLFAEPLDLVTLPRRTTGDAAFDRLFASFAPTGDDLSRAVSPSLRKLLLGWAVPIHAELRPGGFVLCPVTASADLAGLAWFTDAVRYFFDKAAKVPSAHPSW